MTVAALVAAGPLRMGATGGAVKEIQLALKSRGYPLTGTGYFGAGYAKDPRHAIICGGGASSRWRSRYERASFFRRLAADAPICSPACPKILTIGKMACLALT